MLTLRKQDRDNSMTVIVSYERTVPLPRGVGFALWHIEQHGGKIDIFSADRRDRVIARHNRAFGTNLHGQRWLIRYGENPANPVDRTSHCYYSDGNRAYRRRNGQQIPAGGRLPWYMVGLDLADQGEVESVDGFLRVARHLGYSVVQPYPVGGERHHVVFVKSPIPVLERWNVISKERG